jgi:exodeoxyribonuclease-5
MDRNQSDLAFVEIIEIWLREELASDGGSLLAEMVLRDPSEAVDLIHTILHHLRRRRVLTVDAADALAPLVTAYRQAADDFSAFVRNAAAGEEETAVIAAHFSEMAEGVAFGLTAEAPAELIRLLMTALTLIFAQLPGAFAPIGKRENGARLPNGWACRKPMASG